MKTTAFSRNRRLRLEALEERRMLAVTAVSDFEGLFEVYGPQQYWNGNADKVDEVNSFVSGPCEYSNLYSYDGYYHWAGFGYSQVTDNTTAGYLNDMSVFTGSGANGSATYGIGYCDFYSDFNVTVSITDDYVKNFEFSSLKVTNTTYAALSINGGDEFASAFEAGDILELNITGYDANNQSVGTVTVTMADYSNGQEYVLDEWLEVDISSLKDAVSLGFAMTTTDIDPTYGPNTPLYFAIDDVTLVGKDEIVVDFEDVGAGLNAESYYAGGISSSREETWFTSGPCEFVNSTDFSGYYWDGWAYSNTTDTITEGYLNQFSAYTGGGADGSATYGIAYVAIDFNDYLTGEFVDPPTTIAISEMFVGEYEFASMEITNTTYAYLSMLNGDGFGKAFDSNDWLLLTVLGKDGEGNVVDTIDFYLAQDGHILDDWTTLDLSQFNGQGIVALDFDMDSSDSGYYGMNTPAYFAVDDIVLKKKAESSEPIEPQPGDVLYVSTLSDVDDGVYTQGNLSLREAVKLAALWAETDTIRFADELAGRTITLTGGEMAIKSDVTIVGNGVTIDAQNQSRIFNITGTSKNTIEFSVSCLTLTGGYDKTYGGAVYATYADTTWSDVTFTDNSASYGGAVYQKTGSSTFSAVTFIGNSATYGGAFYLAAGNADITNNSRFEGNGATYGGAVYSKGELDVMDTIFKTNTAIWGGGLYLAGGNAMLTDTTFSGNQAAAKSGSAVAKTAGSKLTVTKNSQTILDTALAKYLEDSLM